MPIWQCIKPKSVEKHSTGTIEGSVESVGAPGIFSLPDLRAATGPDETFERALIVRESPSGQVLGISKISLSTASPGSGCRCPVQPDAPSRMAGDTANRRANVLDGPGLIEYCDEIGGTLDQCSKSLFISVSAWRSLRRLEYAKDRRLGTCSMGERKCAKHPRFTGGCAKVAFILGVNRAYATPIMSVSRSSRTQRLAPTFDFLGYTVGRFYGRDGRPYWGTRRSRKVMPPPFLDTGKRLIAGAYGAIGIVVKAVAKGEPSRWWAFEPSSRPSVLPGLAAIPRRARNSRSPPAPCRALPPGQLSKLPWPARMPRRKSNPLAAGGLAGHRPTKFSAPWAVWPVPRADPRIQGRPALAKRPSCPAISSFSATRSSTTPFMCPMDRR